MVKYTEKNVLIIFTGGTVAGNVAKSNISQNKKSDPNSFIEVLHNSIEIIKKNWNIEINSSIIELFNVDSSNIHPENWTKLIETIQEKYDDYDSFVILHGTNTMGYTASALSF
jgi:L-asparaginase